MNQIDDPTSFIRTAMPLCATLGITANRPTPQRVELAMEWSEALCTSNHVLHGGAVMALAATGDDRNHECDRRDGFSIGDFCDNTSQPRCSGDSGGDRAPLESATVGLGCLSGARRRPTTGVPTISRRSCPVRERNAQHDLRSSASQALLHGDRAPRPNEPESAPQRRA